MNLEIFAIKATAKDIPNTAATAKNYDKYNLYTQA